MSATTPRSAGSELAALERHRRSVDTPNGTVSLLDLGA